MNLQDDVNSIEEYAEYSHASSCGCGCHQESGNAQFTHDQLAGLNNTALPSFNYAQAGNQISRDNRKWDGGEFGTSANVTISFLNNQQADSGFNQLSSTQIEGSLLAMDLWSQAANITFTWVDENTANTYSDGGEIQFQAYAGNNAGWASYGWYNTAPSLTLTNATIALGGDSFSLALHEIGHAIGLSHPGNYNGGGNSYAGNAEFYEDTKQYSVMSYWNGSNTGADLFEYRQDNSGNWIAIGGATGLGLYDIAAIQNIYGANTTTYLGDTIYGFNSNTGDAGWTLTSEFDWIQAAIWDAGGIDTIDASGYSDDAHIDLHEESFSSIGALKLNLSIAKGAIIENAIGGSGNDELIGNDVGNALLGGYGNDSISGNNGADILLGGDGNDTLNGGSGNDYIVGGSGNDYLTGNDGYDVLDYLGSTSGVYVELYLNRASNDGFGSSDTLFEFEWVNGSNHADTLIGDASDNILIGNSNNDVLFGAPGNDYLVGGSGSDYLAGSLGFDQFAFSAQDFAAGIYDTITDFNQVTNDFDRIVFTGLTSADLIMTDYLGDAYITTTALNFAGAIAVMDMTVADIQDQLLFI